MTVHGKTVLVVGMARSGIAAAALLLEHDNRVVITDRRDEASFEGGLDQLKAAGAVFALGESEPSLEGIDAVIISPGVPITSPIVKAAQKKGIPLYGELELAYRMSQGKVIAITGTNGKTTTTALTGEIFKNAGKLTYVVGNIGIPYTSIADKTRPGDVVVAEVSSFQLETVVGFHPVISAILNVSEDHLDRHGTMEAYIQLKARVFENQRTDDVAVLNYDDPAVRALSEKAPAKVMYFSRTQAPPCGAYVEDGSIVFVQDGVRRVICKAREVRIPGPHNLENALAATAIAMAAEVPAPVIRHTLRTFAGVEHRIEYVREIEGVTYYNDSKGTNVNSVLSAVRTMDKPTVILLGGSDKHADFAPLAREMSDSPHIQKAVLLGQTAPQIAQALKEAGFSDYQVSEGTFAQAVALARQQARPGWNVLLSPACASFDMFSDYEERGRVFKQIVQDMVAEG